MFAGSQASTDRVGSGVGGGGGGIVRTEYHLVVLVPGFAIYSHGMDENLRPQFCQ